VPEVINLVSDSSASSQLGRGRGAAEGGGDEGCSSGVRRPAAPAASGDGPRAAPGDGAGCSSAHTTGPAAVASRRLLRFGVKAAPPAVAPAANATGGGGGGGAGGGSAAAGVVSFSSLSAAAQASMACLIGRLYFAACDCDSPLAGSRAAADMLDALFYVGRVPQLFPVLFTASNADTREWAADAAVHIAASPHRSHLAAQPGAWRGLWRLLEGSDPKTRELAIDALCELSCALCLPAAGGGDAETETETDESGSEAPASAPRSAAAMRRPDAAVSALIKSGILTAMLPENGKTGGKPKHDARRVARAWQRIVAAAAQSPSLRAALTSAGWPERLAAVVQQQPTAAKRELRAAATAARAWRPAAAARTVPVAPGHGPARGGAGGGRRRAPRCPLSSSSDEGEPGAQEDADMGEVAPPWPAASPACANVRVGPRSPRRRRMTAPPSVEAVTSTPERPAKRQRREAAAAAPPLSLSRTLEMAGGGLHAPPEAASRAADAPARPALRPARVPPPRLATRTTLPAPPAAPSHRAAPLALRAAPPGPSVAAPSAAVASAIPSAASAFRGPAFYPAPWVQQSSGFAYREAMVLSPGVKALIAGARCKGHGAPRFFFPYYARSSAAGVQRQARQLLEEPEDYVRRQLLLATVTDPLHPVVLCARPLACPQRPAVELLPLPLPGLLAVAAAPRLPSLSPATAGADPTPAALPCNPPTLRR
jgi:hypothetical protein